MSSTPPDAVLESFSLGGGEVDATEPGNVHDTHVVTVPEGRFVLQRINTDVFAEPAALMENALLTASCMERAGARPLEYRRTVGGALIANGDAGAWRSYRFVEGTIIGRPTTAADAARIGEAFGRFDAAMSVEGPDGLHTVIPNYHDQRARVAALERAVTADALGRLDATRWLLHDLRSALGWLDAQPGAESWTALPRRVAHHDAKGVNLVFGDDGSFAVLDLDTVMAGTILSDIGELIRTCARPASEGAAFDIAVAAAAVHGFLAGWGLGLAPAETAALPVAGVRMTLQNAVRFLTDHLAGDRYYRVAEPGLNLERSRVMLAHAEAQIAVHDEFCAALPG